MKILFAASECVPFIKTGGLADVVGSLAPTLAKMGNDVRVILPLYSAINDDLQSQFEHVTSFDVDLGWRKQYCGIEKLEKDGVIFYFIDNKYYFARSYVYGLGGDEHERFGFFCRAVLEALPIIDFKPDIIHAHDWQTGFIPALNKIQYANNPFYEDIRTVFTIHNLQYQGIFSIEEVKEMFNLADDLFTSDKLECFGCANFMKTGIVYTDLITTVSKSYSEEITTAYYGERLDSLIRARKNSLFGVVNGIDTQLYNPETDPDIPYNYTAKNFSGKSRCKSELQKELGLNVSSGTPLIGIISRLTSQKGFDLIERVITDIMSDDIQLVVLGMGESRYIDLFSWAEQQFPGKVITRFAMDNKLAHRIYAGSDMFLMPSLFEPCGLSQLISMRYGTVPIVRETGGLRDTVLSYNEFTDEGNGFSFFNYNAHDMLATIRRAVGFYRYNKKVFRDLKQRGMNGDYTWNHSAVEYINIYNKISMVLYNFDEDDEQIKIEAKKPLLKELTETKPAEQNVTVTNSTEKKDTPDKKISNALINNAKTVRKKPATRKASKSKKYN